MDAAAADEELLQPWIQRRTAQLDGGRHHRQTWTARQLAIVDVMREFGVRPTVVEIRRFLEQHPGFRTQQSPRNMALKLMGC